MHQGRIICLKLLLADCRGRYYFFRGRTTRAGPSTFSFRDDLDANNASIEFLMLWLVKWLGGCRRMNNRELFKRVNNLALIVCWPLCHLVTLNCRAIAIKAWRQFSHCCLLSNVLLAQTSIMLLGVVQHGNLFQTTRVVVLAQQMLFLDRYTIAGQ